MPAGKTIEHMQGRGHAPEERKKPLDYSGTDDRYTVHEQTVN